MEEKDLFLELRKTLEDDLRATGFTPDRTPPSEEPRIPQGLKDLPNEDLKGLYDDFLAFFEYLSDQVAKAGSYALVSKARLEAVAAKATLSSANDRKLSNAELRKAYVVNACLGAKRDYVYFKAKVDVHDARLRKISKSMDRIGRELWFRAQDEPERNSDFSVRKAKPVKKFRSSYKEVPRDQG